MRTKLTAQFVESVKAPERGQVDYWEERTHGLGLRVSQGGKRAWTVCYRIGGRMRRLTLGPYPSLSLADARRLATTSLGEVHHGNDPATAKREARAAETFGELEALYLERHATVAKRSWAADERLLERELIPAWKHRSAREIWRRLSIALVDNTRASVAHAW